MEEEAFTKDLSQEIGKVVATEVAALEKKVRTEVETELKEQEQERIDSAVADAIAQYGADVSRGYTDNGEGGVLEFGKGDTTMAQQANLLMDSSWKPLVVDDPSEGGVRRALVEFINGGPIASYNIGSDEDSSILMQVMMSCEQKSTIDPHAKSIVANLTNYTIGTGLQYSCSVDSVDETLREFARENHLETRLKYAVRSRFIYGEHYFFYYIDPQTGMTYVRDGTRPYDIRAVQTHPEDTEIRLAYGRTKGTDELSHLSQDNERYAWFADIDYFEQRVRADGVSARGTGRMSNRRLVQMCKFGNPGDVRGAPPMYPILRFLKYYEDFVTDRIVLNHERSKVVWVRKVMGNRKITGGRAQRGPVGGQILTETPQLEWKVIKPQINADDVTEDGRLIRLAIAAGVNMPEHLLFQDPSNQVYASIRAQDTPFSQSVRSYQYDWVKDMEVMFRTVLREKVRAGRLPEEVSVETFTLEAADKLYDELYPMIKEGADRQEIRNAVGALADEAPTTTRVIPTTEVVIDMKFPEVVQQDPIKTAQESEILHRMGLASKTELAARHGYNYKQTAKLMSMEKSWMPEEDNEEEKGRSTYQKRSDTPREPEGEN